MAMRASVSIYVLVNVIAHGELKRLVVREVAQLAMNSVVFVQWKAGWHKVTVCLIAQIFRQMCLPDNCSIFDKFWLIYNLNLFLSVPYSS